jgi:hypothetical protein
LVEIILPPDAQLFREQALLEEVDQRSLIVLGGIRLSAL